VRNWSGIAQSRGCLVPSAIVIGLVGLGAAAAGEVLSALLAVTASCTMRVLEVMP